jgi:DNA-binding response OmpR family regulator
MNKKSVLVIDDDPIVHDIFNHLFGDKYEIFCEFNGQASLSALESRSFDYCIIDLTLTDMHGLNILKKIQTEKLQPNAILMILTASQDVANEIEGHELGIKEYIKKPIVPKLMKAIFKKYEELSQESSFKYGNLEIDLKQMRAFYNGEMVELTNSEFRILLQLIQNPGDIFSREALYQSISTKSDEAQVDRSIDMHISALRRKIKDVGDHIKTKRGKGYYFEV